jgi:hypothetical protein
MNDLISKKGDFINLLTLPPNTIMISWSGREISNQKPEGVAEWNFCIPLFSIGVDNALGYKENFGK